jgi:hypothetical protein
MTGSARPTPLQDYLFDLHGFLILPGVVMPAAVAEMNRAIDGWLADGGEWLGEVHRDDSQRGSRGDRIWFQNVVAGGVAFEELIDHPGWLGLVRRYLDPDGLHLWGNEVSLGGPGSFTSPHSGGHLRTFRSSYHYHDGVFHCGKIMIIIALADIGPGDGATMVIPGSHTTNLANPLTATAPPNRPPDNAHGLYRELHLRAGDVLLFTDAIEHAAALRANAGHRRILILRYAPCWTGFAGGFEPSDELVSRLTPARREIVRPFAPRRPPVGVGAGEK